MNSRHRVARFREVVRRCVAASLTIATLSAEQLPITLFTAQDGLHTTVNTIVVDSKGFVWFPSSEGLARYDGNEFQLLTPADGLPVGIVSVIYERIDSTYWVAVGEHLCLFDPRSSNARFHCESPKAGVIRSVLEDQRGVWCGTERGLWRRSLGAQSWEPVPDVRSPDASHSVEVIKMLKDEHGDVWVLTDSGLFRFRRNGHAERWLQGERIAMDTGSGLSETPGAIWVGSQTELLRLSIDARSGAAAITGRYLRSDGLPSAYVSDVRFWRGRIWAATYQGLARQLPSGRWELVELGPNLRGLPVNTLAIDAMNNLWAGTDNGGAVRISGSGLSSFSESEGLGVRKVWSVFEDRQGNLLAVTKDEDHYFLNRFDGDRFRPLPLNAPGGIDFGWSWSQIVISSHSGEWWLASGNGLVHYPNGIEQPSSRQGMDGLPLRCNIFRIFEDSTGAIWVSIRGTNENRLYRRDSPLARFERLDDAPGLPPLKMGPNVPSAFLEDRNGAIWIGMLNGVLVRYRNGRFQQFQSSDAPRHGVRALLMDKSGRIWIGSNGDGLFRVDDPSAEQPSFSVYTRAHGLSSNEVHALTEDLDGFIYAAGGRSLDRLDPRTPPETARFRHFTTNEGWLPGGFRVGFRDRHGALWFGGNQGLLRVEPQKDSSNPPNVLIYALMVNGQRRPISDLGDARPAEMFLSSSERQVQVDFGGLRHDLLYQTRLSGLDHDWTPPSPVRRVRYLSLSPGRYELAIRAVTPEGSFSTVPAQVRFFIPSPVWQRWWFLLLSAGTMAGISYAAHRYRLRNVLALERVRIRLASDLHDDLGSGLAEIAILTEVAGQREPSLGLDIVARRARELRSAMSDIVWSVDPSGDNLEELINRWRQTAFALLGEGRLEFLAPPPEQTSRIKLAPDQRRELLLLFKEIATNVARHAGAKRAWICVGTEPDRLRLEIRDDGCGFDPEVNGRGAGLKSMQRRAEALHGTLKIDSKPGAGATVTLLVPLLTA